MMTPPPPTIESTRPRRRPSRTARGVFALAFVGLPALGLMALAALWARSHQVEESRVVEHRGGSYDPVAQAERSTHARIEVVATSGALSFAADWWSDEVTIMDPNRARRIRQKYEAHRPGRAGDLGWRWTYRAEEPAAPGPSPGGVKWADSSEWFRLADARPPANLLGVPRADGWGHPLTYLSWDRSIQPRRHDSARIIAPFWGWMLPLAGPILWWAWCPAGHFLPRLTLRRALAATAGIALLLALLGRSSPVDHAVLSLRAFNADITYGPDPKGSGRPIPVAVRLDRTRAGALPALTPEAAARISRALSQLPTLERLDLSGLPGPTSIETALLPSGRADLVTLDLRESNADAATLARLAEFPNLRRLDLSRSRQIGDDGLAHLRSLPNLSHLTLGHLGIGDAALAHLHGLPNLRQIDFKPGWGLATDPPNRLTLPALRRLADSLPALEELIGPDGTILRPGRPASSSVPPGARP